MGSIEPKELMIGAGILLVIGIVLMGGLGAFALGSGSGGGGSGGSAEQKYDYSCSGTVKADALFSVGASLEDARCVKDKSGWLSCTLGFWDDITAYQEGSVVLVVDGEVYSSQQWESRFGEDQTFSLTSSCTPAGEVSVLLFDDDGVQIDSADGVIQ